VGSLLTKQGTAPAAFCASPWSAAAAPVFSPVDPQDAPANRDILVETAGVRRGGPRRALCHRQRVGSTRPWKADSPKIKRGDQLPCGESLSADRLHGRWLPMDSCGRIVRLVEMLIGDPQL
jgi:hypothetical protein